MKSIVKLMGLVSLAFFLLTCSEEDPANKPGQIQFQVDQFIQPNSSGRVSSSLPPGASLLISIQGTSGNPVMTLERIEILTFGGQSASAPIQLPSGNFKVTDFLVVNELNEVLYAIPKAGSEFAKLVNRPLPFNFTVWKDRVTNFPTQIVRATESAPEKFGYVSFNIDIAAYPEFKLAVFAQQNGQLNLTQAKVFLIHDKDTIYSKVTGATYVNEIIFEADPQDTLTLIVRKDQFSSFKKTFVLHDLRNELNGASLEVILRPAITFTISIGQTEFPDYYEMSFLVDGDADKYLIADWEDGTIDTISLSDATVVHRFFSSTHRDLYWHVSISGDIDHIQYLGIGYDAHFSNFNFSNLTKLRRASIHFQSYLTKIDLSHNLELEWLALGYCPVMESIDLPQLKT